MDPIIVFVDGACRSNPEGPGGWGVLIEDVGGTRELCGFEVSTTNNRMELTAAIRALEALPEGAPIEIHTDSQYVQQGITRWVRNWIRRDWRTADGKPVKNVDLWKVLVKLDAVRTVTWHWVPGHSGVAGNERADWLANRAIDRHIAEVL